MAPSASFKAAFGSIEPQDPSSLRSSAQCDTLLSKPGSGSPLEVEVINVNGRTVRSYKNMPKNYRDFWVAKSKEFAKQPYLNYGPHDSVTYEQAWHRSLVVAHWLSAKFQVRRGDKVGICGRNYTEHVITWWAVQLLGAIAVSINAFVDDETIQFCVADARCRVVIVDVERLQRLESGFRGGEGGLLGKGVNDESSELRGVVVIPYGKGKDQPRIPKEKRTYLESNKGSQREDIVFDYDALFEEYSQSAPTSPPKIQISPEDYATILFTSGTTGRPKGVLSTQRQSIHNLGATMWVTARLFLRRNRPLPQPEAMKNEPQSHLLCMYPLFHAAGLLSQLITGTATGSAFSFMYAWDVEDAIKLINDRKINKLSGPAFMVRQIALHPTDTPTLGSMTHGGSSSPSSICGESHAKTQGGIVGQGYGCTETNSLATGCYADDYAHWPDSVGPPCPTTEVKIMDPEKLTEVAHGERGEVWLRSAGIATEYYNRPASVNSAAFLPDGFFRTGDVGYVSTEPHNEGYLFICDRVKDLIIRGGENLSCSVIEGGVYKHKAVREAAAVGLPDEKYGERVVAVVYLDSSAASSSSSSSSEDEMAKDIIKTAASHRSNKQEVPEFIVVRREALPRNAAGKTEKKVLREEVIRIAREKGWGDYAKEGKKGTERESRL